MQVFAAVDSLLTQPLPLADGKGSENLDAARQEMLSRIQSGFPSFREIGYTVAHHIMQGYSEDPNRQKADLLPHITQEDVQQYHSQHVTGNRRIWLVIGDRKLTDMQALQRYGQVIELKKEDIYK